MLKWERAKVALHSILQKKLWTGSIINKFGELTAGEETASDKTATKNRPIPTYLENKPTFCFNSIKLRIYYSYLVHLFDLDVSTFYRKIYKNIDSLYNVGWLKLE